MGGGTLLTATIMKLFLFFVLLGVGNHAGACAAAGSWVHHGPGRSLQQVAGQPQQEPATGVADSVAQCPAVTPVNSSWVPLSDIFNQLSSEEIAAVEEYLTADLRLVPQNYTNGTYALPTDNFLYRIELFPPPKTAALLFLGGQGPRPLRFARAIVYRGAEDPRDMMEYKVGPLPLDPSTAVAEELRRPGEIPFYKYPPSPTTDLWTDVVAGQVAFELRELFRNMTGGKCFISKLTPAEGSNQTSPQLQTDGGMGQDLPSIDGCTAADIDWLQYPDFHNTSASRISLLKWQFVPNRQNGDESYLHPLPISWKVDETDPDPALWQSFDFEYCHQGPFKTAEELLDAFQAGDLKICSAPEYGQPGYNFSWALTNTPAGSAPPTAVPGPRQYSPGGPRFTVSPDEGTGRRFRWLGWEGHASINPQTGLTFNDVTYNGKRIIYELAQQDMFVDYSGYGGSGQTVYFDSAYGMGLNSKPLLRGVDCPWDAHYMDSVLHFIGGGPLVQGDVMCVFEDDMATTAWRHTHLVDTRGPHVDFTRAFDLVFRTVSSIGNYDYIVDIRFRQDASLEVRLTAAGYMSTLFHDPNGATFRDRPFGTRVQKYVLANIHDHLSGWKVDLDIEGRNNTFHVTEVKVGTYKDALADMEPNANPPGWWTNLPLKYLHRYVPPTEAGYTIEISRPKGFQIINEKATNQWGAPRGYAIVHGATTAQLLPDTHPLTKAAAWTKYHLAVTQHHDNEQHSHASIYDFYKPDSPVVSLDSYLNGEPVTSTDLVAWVMMGLQHVPRSEDIPLIYNMYANFFIKPWNYFDQNEALLAGAWDGDLKVGCTPPPTGEATYRWSI